MDHYHPASFSDSALMVSYVTSRQIFRHDQLTIAGPSKN